ncbi:MAG TPA: FdtA/QdtA family cupin domain-containing protein [Ignavibacteriaceae bacterium]|nr:FdtA/QdtA family cupin domain-containing protein [Ignavibacteriaceae bacterium]
MIKHIFNKINLINLNNLNNNFPNSMKPKLIDLPKIEDNRGNLSFIEQNNHIPFEIKRAYWIYDVPGGEIRGSHAYKTHNEYIVALSGSFDVVLHDGKEEKKYSLNRSYYGLYIPQMCWRRLENFSSNSLALILADEYYDENDYIRDFEEFSVIKTNGY